MLPSMHRDSHARRKELGAYYTGDSVVEFLVRWGMRKSHRVVLDPSCGDARFLAAAAEHGARVVIGCDLDAHAKDAALARLRNSRCERLIIGSDFFTVSPEALQRVDLVVGNPPFIRYHRFTGEARKRALESAFRLGVKLTQLTSSWAPFLLHALRFLKTGGDMAVVVPAEIIQTQYGLPTLHALADRFESITLLAFERNVFEAALEETFLMLAENLGGNPKGVRIIPLRSAAELTEMDGRFEGSAQDLRGVSFERRAHVRFVEAFLSEEERRAWAHVTQHPCVKPIAALGSLTNGYVSGDNEFFHCCRSEGVERGYPVEWLFPTARNSRSLRGLSFTAQDIAELEAAEHPHHLILPEEDLFVSDREALRRFVDAGEKRRVPQHFKCRTRNPWWRVPGLVQPDILLSYMSGAHPRISVNRVAAYYTNTLHGLRVSPGISAEAVALAFHTSLAQLSLEIEGRSYGGGILKLEPSEMLRVCLPWPEEHRDDLNSLYETADGLLRAGRFNEVQHLADRYILGEQIGLTGQTIELLRMGRERLSRRRLTRSRRSGDGS